MKYVKRTLQSEPGLSQEDALNSLQSSPQWRQGSRLGSIRRRGSRWVVDVLEPKTAGPGGPPAFAEEGPDDGPEESGPPEDEESSGPPIPDDSGDESGDSESGPPKPKGEEGGDKKPGGKGGVEEAILHTLTQILHALTGGDPEGMGGLDALGPAGGGPAAPPPPKAGPPHGGPPGGAGPGAGPSGRPMRPGEAPPGSTPVGAPSFAHTTSGTRQFTANPIPGVGPTLPPTGAPSATPGAVPAGPAGPVSGGTCPTCGYPEPCPMHGGAAGAPGAAGAGIGGPVAAVTAQVQKLAGRSRYITLKAPGNQRVSDAVKVARQAVQPFGYQVQKAKRRADGSIVIITAAR